jgi:isopenicillin N synthase-like dioxygenase
MRAGADHGQGVTWPMDQAILDVDLLAFERGSAATREAAVDGVMRSLSTGFVYTSSDLSTDLLDAAYGLLQEFFCLDSETKQRFQAPGANGQTGYTGVLVETAAGSDRADWKEMLNWSAPLPAGHPLKRRYPGLYPDQVLPEAAVPGITAVLGQFHHAIADLQRRFLRLIALGMGCAEEFFEDIVSEAPTLTRALRYPPMPEAPPGGHLWAAAHGDINLITALPRATAPGLQIRVAGEWLDAEPPDGRVIINTGLMLERLSNGRLPTGWHRVVAPEHVTGPRLSVVQFCHARPWTILAPVPSCCGGEHPQRYAAISAADALEAVLYRINLLEH